MLDVETKSRINTARDILVGKVPDPKSQVEQITIALIYKFMDDMDVESEELGGKRTFFVGEYAKYAWRKIFDPRQSGYDLLNLYSEAIGKMDTNPGVPKLFRDIFKNAYLPYRDPETLKSFLKIINEFDYSHSEKLGDAFEYLLSVLGSQGDAGQFRTPRHIIDFMVEIVDPKKDETILDPACGTSGFLISSYKHIIRQNSSNYNPDKHNGVSSNSDQSVADRIISTNGYAGDKLTADDRKILAKNIHGYDISPDMVRLSLVNMYLHGIKDPKIYEYDTLTSEDNWHHFSDVILANPPFMSPKGGIRPHKRFSVQSNRSEVLFVDYIAEHLTANGRAAVIVPEGIIFQSGKAYKQLRKKLVEECLVGVISLPAGVFNPYAGVKTSILWLDKALAKKTDQILFIKIDHDGYDLGAQRRVIKANDLPGALSEILNYKEAISEERLSESDEHFVIVKKQEIFDYDEYNLSAERYRKRVENHSKFEIVEIKTLVTFQGGYAFKSEELLSEKTDNCIPVIKIGNINRWGKVSLNPVQYFTYDASLKRFLINEKDILVAMTGATVGKVAVSSFGNMLLNQRVGIIRTSSMSLSIDFLSLLLRDERFYSYCQKTAGGGAQGNISPDEILKFKIPLPPISVQEEIVAEIESYQRIIDGARQVVENYKPRIDIDPDWVEYPISDFVIKTQLGIVKGKADQSPDFKYPYIKMNNITVEGYLDLSDIVFVNASEKELQEGTLNDGDFIYNTRNSPELVGKSAVYHGENGKYLYNNNILRITFNGRLNPDYTNWILNSQYGKGKIHQIVDGTTSVAAIYQKNFLAITIPVAPMALQNTIVNRINEELYIIEQNRRLIALYDQKIKDRIAKVWGE